MGSSSQALKSRGGLSHLAIAELKDHFGPNSKCGGMKSYQLQVVDVIGDKNHNPTHEELEIAEGKWMVWAETLHTGLNSQVPPAYKKSLRSKV